MAYHDKDDAKRNKREYYLNNKDSWLEKQKQYYQDNTLEISAKRKKLYNKHRSAWIQQNGPCKCGSWKDLEIDHINPKDKTIGVNALWVMRPDNPKVVTELAKCQVLCWTCHRDKCRTEGSLSKGAKHPRRGQDHPHAVLTTESILDIREQFANSVPAKTLAQIYQVSPNTIWDICAKRRWKHIL